MDYREFIQLDLPVAVAIVSCGADWRVEEANAEFTDVLGYTEKELRETRPQKMVYDEDYANLVSVLENVVRTHDNGKMQLRIVRPDGKTRWVEMRCSVLAHYDVKPYVVLFLWDIDEEKRREEHQKLLNQKYELMEQLSLEYPFDLDVENWTMLRSYRLMELRGQYDYSEQYFPPFSYMIYLPCTKSSNKKPQQLLYSNNEDKHHPTFLVYQTSIRPNA